MIFFAIFDANETMCDGSDDRLCARVDMDVFDNKPLIRGGMTAGLRPLAARERLITRQLKPPHGAAAGPSSAPGGIGPSYAAPKLLKFSI